MNTSYPAQLLAIVEVPHREKVLCGQAGCGHGVWKAIHVVLDGNELLVLGSTCFKKRYGSVLALGSPHYGRGDGRKLTPEERQLLVENTAAFVARMKDEVRLHAEAVARSRAEADELAAAEVDARRALASRPTKGPTNSLAKSSPWPWMKPITSLGYFKLHDGSGWVRVQRNDGQQVLVPWPKFDGWEEALPAHLGVTDEELGGYLLVDVRAAVAYLQQIGEPCRVFGSWRNLASQPPVGTA